MLNSIKYYDNDKQHGIVYDWKIIKKEFDKLGMPKNVTTPFKLHDVASGKWFVDLSERSIGKTTNWIILGLVMNQLYNTQLIYVRQIVDMILPKRTGLLFKTIIEFDYISKITGGRWDSVKYRSRAYYYYNTETLEISDEPFMLLISIDENQKNKSSVNAPNGDLIIYDEFISTYTHQNEFVEYADTIKTIIRERDSALIVLLANTIDKHHIYFKELGIYDTVQKMEINTMKQVTTDGGTLVEVALLGTRVEEMPVHRRKHNEKFFGFKNPLLNSIRGGDWAVKIYPHPPRLANAEILNRTRYIRYNGYYLNIELWNSEELGLFVKCHIANNTYDDSIIYNIDTTITSKNERYKWGTSKLDDLLKKLLITNKWYYVTNMEGNLIESYIRELKDYNRFR